MVIAGLMAKGTTYVGTSNVYLSMKYGTTPIGTMAHELIMGIGQGDPAKNPAYSNRFVMEDWTKMYGVLSGTFLTDTITDEICRMDMDFKFASSFKGVRNDSGDPFVWGENWIKHYEKLGINPKEKMLLFSNSLDFETADKIYRHFKDRINVAFGIGTYLSNDTFVKPFNIVMKMTSCNGHPVAKISDDAGKGMCKDSTYVEYLNRSLDWRKTHKY
jgi:nicotinate phosphoribosyltransferase